MVLCAFFAGGLTAIFPVDNTFSFGPSPSGLSPFSASFTIRLLPVGQGGCLHFRKTNQTSWQLPYPGSGPFPFSGTMAFIVPLDPVFFEPDASARTSHPSACCFLNWKGMPDRLQFAEILADLLLAWPADPSDLVGSAGFSASRIYRKDPAGFVNQAGLPLSRRPKP